MTIAQKTGSDPVIEPDPVFVRTRLHTPKDRF